MIDIVIPQNNERELEAMAHKLGYKELLFLYPIDGYSDNYKGKVLKIKFGVLLDSKTTNNNLIQKLKREGKFIAAFSSENDRKLAESGSVNLLIGVEADQKRDFLHQRGSGINHILAKILEQNKITLCFPVSEIISSSNRHSLLGKMKQNINLCKKYEVKTAIASLASSPMDMRSPKDVVSLFFLLGMEKDIIKKSLN